MIAIADAHCGHRVGLTSPAYEGGEDRAVGGCYMYRPVRPVVVTVDDGEKRPVFASPMIAGRVRYDSVAGDMILVLREVDGAGNIGYKKTIEKDEVPKSKQ